MMKLIIDCDTGLDDAQALMLALSHKQADIVAITCVSGNTDVDNVCRNVLRVLSVWQRLEIPLYRGCSKQIIDTGINATQYHGKDGLNDIEHLPLVNLDLIKSEHASLAIVKLINENKGDITIVSLGPMTNIALATKIDPGICRKIRKLVFMGGNTEGKGNITPAAEFNFRADPEAASIVLKELQCPMVNVSWELILSHGYPWDWFKGLLNTDTNKGRFHKTILTPAMDAYDEWSQPHYFFCDPTAVAVALEESIVTEGQDVYATVELHGTITRGQMICDWEGRMNKPPNVTIVSGIDIENMKALFSEVFLDNCK